MSSRLIPNDSTADVVTFAILIEGSEIDQTYQVMSVVTTKEVNRIPSAQIILRDGNAAEETFEASESDDFIPGKKIEIKFGRDSKNETVFKGIILKHSIKISESGDSILKIECRDESIKMTVGRKNKYFTDKKDSEIIKSIIGDGGLSAGTITATKVEHPEMIQYHTSDWDFIMTRAEANGLLVFANDGKVDVKAPDTSSAEIVELIFGSTILSFDAEMDARYQWPKVEATSWDYSTQKIETAKSKEPSFKENGNITGKKLSEVLGLEKFELRHSGQVVKEELKEWADGCLLKSRLSRMRGRAKFIGYGKIKVGDVVKVSGVGKRFNGPIYITAVRQEMNEGAWFTHVQFGLSYEWFYEKYDVPAAPGAGLTPAVHGLQIGVVVKMHDDPDGNDRIQIKLPIVDNDADGIWARVASLDAGNSRGAFFRPEVGDEVVVGFINGDSRDAIVVGMLNSQKLPAPIVADEENTEKGFVTRSEIKLLFDDVKKIFTVETPGGNSFVIDDDQQSISLKDQHGNSIIMDADGITLDSAAKVIITAAQDVEATAGTAFKAESGTDLSLNAGTQLKAEGAAGATLSTSAIAEIKGSLVKIN